MSNEMNPTNQTAPHAKLASRLKMAEANLDVMKARAEAAKASVEINAIAALIVAKPRIKLKLQELTQSGHSHREQTKRDLAAFEKAVREIKSKIQVGDS
jgi:hypothetical protein